MRKSLYDYAIENNMEYLLDQWDQEKNVGITPKSVAYGAHNHAWWRCEKGHEWRAQIRSRTNGNGCPICANRVVKPGKNDLATTHPEVAQQWHPTKNGELTPQKVTAGREEKV